METSDNGKVLIKSFEGCAKKRPDGSFDAYPDPGTGGDPWTIGWGSTGQDIHRGTIWTQANCDLRFALHLQTFEHGIQDLVAGFPTSQNQFDAMVSLAYNIGLANFRSSTLLKRHRSKLYAQATAEFLKWNRAGGHVLDGLTRRREAEAALYSTKGN